MLSIHPRNIKNFIKIPSHSLIGKAENRILQPSSESFMELGVSCNNNTLFPLIDIVISSNLPNKKQLMELILHSIMNFNTIIKSYPQYRNYLQKNTKYDISLEKTLEKHLKYFKVNYYDQMFLKKPGIFFLVKLAASVEEEREKDNNKSEELESKLIFCEHILHRRVNY